MLVEMNYKKKANNDILSLHTLLRTITSKYMTILNKKHKTQEKRLSFILSILKLSK